MSGGASAPAGTAGGPRLVALLVVVIALLTGILVGVAADRRLAMHGHGPWWGRGQQMGHLPRGPWGGGGDGGGDGGGGGQPDRVRQRFASELGLTPTQMAQVDSIMARSMAARRALEDSMRPRMQATLDSTRSEIERVLTPDQRQKFAAWRSRAHGGRGA
jgi:Spy/CpxP family protein refolding chaperone